MSTATWVKDESTTPSDYGDYTFGVVSGKTQLPGSFPDYTSDYWDKDLSGISSVESKRKEEFDDVSVFGRDQ
jgi:hypothetical protein